jgi:hypothetical protein
LSPISTSRRTASERETSCDFAHASILVTAAGSNRMGIVSLYFTPAGRPLDFLCTVFDCFAILFVYTKSEPRGSANFRPWGWHEQRSKQMTPTKIILEKTSTHLQLKVLAADTQKGYSVIESVPFKNGDSLPTLRKHGASYAKRFSIPFVDATA